MPASSDLHSFGWHYIYLRLLAGLIRSISRAAQWYKPQKRNIHEGVVVKCSTIPSRDEGRNIKVHFYHPVDYDSIKPTPVLVNWHGSGFAIPCLVFDADYRKAPEYPFPAAIEDAEDITHYLAARPDQYDASNIFLSGTSAGGNIALVRASTLGPERIRGVIAFYPPVNFTTPEIAPETRILAGYVIHPSISRFFQNSYILPSHRRTNPHISPALAPTESFPDHVYLVCGNADSLYISVDLFVQRLKEAGHNDVEFVGLKYMGHAFDFDAKGGTEAEENKNKAYTGAVNMINRTIVYGANNM